MRVRLFPLLLIIINLISAAIILVLALTGRYGGSDENLTVVGYFWGSFLIILSFLLMLESRLGRLFSIILTLSYPIIIVFAFILTPNMGWNFATFLHPVGFFWWTGNIIWFLWLTNLIFIIRRKL